MRRLRALVVHEPLGNSDDSPWLQRAESFLEQLTAAFFTFTVQNVAKSGDVVAVAKICLQHIALEVIEPITDAELLCNSFCGWNHSRPIDCSHAHPRRFFGECNAPNARTCGKVKHTDFVLCFHQMQMIAERLCRRIAHWNDVFHQLTEKFSAFSFLVHRDGRTTFANDVG